MPGAAQFLPDSSSLKKDRRVKLKVCQCSGCGLVQLGNDPVPYYKEVIRACGFSKEMKAFRSRQFRAFIQNFSLTKKKVIEIGCGRGEYLALIEQLGVEAYGLEYSRKAVAQCVKDGLKVSKGFVTSRNFKLKHAPFDAFFILNFLEHLPEPNSAIMGICNNLTDGAVGLVEVPNFDMILRKKLFSEFISDHLLYFTKDTLAGTLRLNGFEILGCSRICDDYIISAAVKKRGRPDLSSFYKSQAELKNEINKYIRRFRDKNVAIWGAGHQALAVISLADLAGRIKYVIDSATFKQGRYTPATHVPIFSPEALKSEPPEAIIVIAGSYSDEVAGIIRREFGRGMNVSILRDFGLEIM
ncbi:MAG: class I SAM-dependent methyltransferase [Candidatus Omnitrophica bacterium]|nr:class I SAM-dependent methyltransferase [Candidatus Omnitrophota bacterium]